MKHESEGEQEDHQRGGAEVVGEGSRAEVVGEVSRACGKYLSDEEGEYELT
jgi:hypothetical protein